MRSGITSFAVLAWLLAASSVLSAPIEGDKNRRRLIAEAALNIEGRAAVPSKAPAPVKQSKTPVPVQQSKTPLPVKSTMQSSKAPPITSAPSVAPSKSVVPVSQSSALAPVPSSVKSVPSSASGQATSGLSSIPSSAPGSSSASAISSASAQASSARSSAPLSGSLSAGSSALTSSGASAASSAPVSASAPSGSSAKPVSASATVSSQSASASSSALPAPPPCSANCLAPEREMRTADLLPDLDMDGVVAVSNNGTKGTNTTTAVPRDMLSKRAGRDVHLCGSTITSTTNGATAFRIGVAPATPATAYTWTNPNAQDFDIVGSTVTTAQTAPYIIEHVFEFQLMKHFLEAHNELCQQAAVTSAFQDIVNLIDNPSNMVYAHTIINEVKLQVVASNQFGISSLETGFIAAGQFSSQLNDLGQQPAVDARLKAQLMLRSTGGLINYLNLVAPIFKSTATAIKNRLETAQAGTGTTFTTWLEGEVEKYQGRVTFIGGLMARNYQFQAVGRPNALAVNNFNPAQMVTDIGGNGFPRLNTDGLTP
ncbi:hypothetical protein B0H10DRAFT_806596 [Mycena sp. CBHHK59/15]|nr:hypothetical protein B0H10DRAFT_806596 [Mycena sp. CBHHK59/15]